MFLRVWKHDKMHVSSSSRFSFWARKNEKVVTAAKVGKSWLRRLRYFLRENENTSKLFFQNANVEDLTARRSTSHESIPHFPPTLKKRKNKNSKLFWSLFIIRKNRHVDPGAPKSWRTKQLLTLWTSFLFVSIFDHSKQFERARSQLSNGFRILENRYVLEKIRMFIIWAVSWTWTFLSEHFEQSPARSAGMIFCNVFVRYDWGASGSPWRFFLIMKSLLVLGGLGFVFEGLRESGEWKNG